MELARPIAERGGAAVPFLIDQLSSEKDDVAVRDILLIFDAMASTRAYDDRADSSLMGALTSLVSAMKDKDWQAICLKRLQRIRKSR